MTCTKCHGLAVEERIKVETIWLTYWHCLNCGLWVEQGHTPIPRPTEVRGRGATVPAQKEAKP